MHNSAALRHSPATSTASASAATATATSTVGSPAVRGWCSRRNLAALAESEFAYMRTIYRPTGGVARVEELVDLFSREQGPTPNTLASWIERRQVICFEWNDAIWLPWFQFHRVALVPHPQLAAVFAELTPVFDQWELANWFAQPNAWLAGRIPVNVLLRNLDAVLEAARADRFIARG